MKKVQQGFTLIELMIVVAIIGILAAIAIPQYQDYIARSQMNRGYGEVSALKTAVEDGMNRGEFYTSAVSVGATPSSIQAGATLADQVPAVAFDATGAGTLTLVFGNAASNAITGVQIQLTRTVDGIWTCLVTVGGNAAYKDSYTPKSCTQA